MTLLAERGRRDSGRSKLEEPLAVGLQSRPSRESKGRAPVGAGVIEQFQLKAGGIDRNVRVNFIERAGGLEWELTGSTHTGTRVATDVQVLHCRGAR
mgnify:CR=1 FL=1